MRLKIEVKNKPMRFIARSLGQCCLAVLCCLPAVSYVYAVSDDVALASAWYAFNVQEMDRALLILNRAEISEPVVDNTKRLALKAEVLVSLARYDDANSLFEQLLQDTRSQEFMPDIAFPLAELNFEKGDCQAALKFLGRSKTLSSVLHQQAFYMRSSCLAQQGKVDVVVIEKMAVNFNAFISANKKSLNIWMAYSYYNIAVAALNNDQLLIATGYFSMAKKYLDSSLEGQALKEKILLTQATASYVNNQYDVALEQLSKLDINGYWTDQSLLVFGWSAFYNYNHGLALEAWRQLVSSSNKSMNFYEGMLVIPFVLEKSNAFAKAINAYDLAVNEYDLVLKKIDVLESNLKVGIIRSHAIESVSQKDELVASLHPLLGTYTQSFFRTAVKRVEMVAVQRQRLYAYKKRLLAFSKMLSWKSGARNADLQALIKRVDDVIGKNLRVERHVEAYLQELTLSVLAGFREKIQEYQRQARIARARLREELYQLGGRRL